MILVLLIAIPVAGGLAALATGTRRPLLSRWLSLAAMTLDLALAVGLWLSHANSYTLTRQGGWQSVFSIAWIPQFGITFSLAVDGLSILMILLTAFLGVIAVAASWSEIQERVGFYHLNLLWVLAGVMGVFLSTDLFLFYFFWELMIVPMYFLIGIWGHENRVYASTKFFIFTQASGLLMLLAILGLYFEHYRTTGILTFDYNQLLGTTIEPPLAAVLMLGFFIAFAVKLPAFPFHTWLPDAHTEAPTAGSVILAGLLLKTGAYGLLRFVLPLFHDAAMRFAPVAMILGVIGILYGALLAFAQKDLKRLVAYTSVSHLGFVLLGIFAWNDLALQGAILEMICHGLSTGGLFVLAGILQERLHTRDMDRMGGLWESNPRTGAVGMFFALASLGLPGLGNFVAEFLILVGTYQAHPVLAIVAAIGLIAATVYSLWIIHRIFYGESRERWKMPDLSLRHLAIFGSMILVLVWLGLYPQPVLRTAQSAVATLQQNSSSTIRNPQAPETVIPAHTTDFHDNHHDH
jgi:NADH-quinone oxidoreductase subunit M